MQMDSRSSHPRILRGRASEVFLTNQPQAASRGKSPSAYVYMYICMYIFIYIDICIYVYTYVPTLRYCVLYGTA